MNDTDFDAARAALIDARRRACVIDPVPAAWVPPDLDEAYRLQDAVARATGPVRGWKVSGLTAAQQQAMGTPCAIAAPLLEPWVRACADASFDLGAFIAPRLECEFAFELRADLPMRDGGHTREAVEAAIGALRIVVEIVDSRLPPSSPVLLQLADALNNGAFVVGATHGEWRKVAYATQAIELRRDADGATIEIARGDGSAILDGDPVGAVVLLANLQQAPPRGLRAGDIVTTGSCTGAVAVPGPGRYEADFGTLGSVRFELLG